MKVAVICVPLFAAYLFIIPSINKSFRELSWFGGLSATEAYSRILTKEYIDQLDFKADNWEFLTTRASEMSLYVKYVDFVPESHDYYKMEIIRDAF